MAGGQEGIVRARIAVAALAHQFEDTIPPEKGDQLVGGGVVADRDHQGGERVQRQRRTLGPVLQLAAGIAFDGQGHDIVPLALARADILGKRGEDIELEGRSQREARVGGEADHRLAPVERAEPRVDAAGQGGEIGGDLLGAVADRDHLLHEQPVHAVAVGRIDRDLEHHPRAFEPDRHEPRGGVDRSDRLDPGGRAELAGQGSGDGGDLGVGHLREQRGGEDLLGLCGALQHPHKVLRARLERGDGGGGLGRSLRQQRRGGQGEEAGAERGKTGAKHGGSPVSARV